MGSYAPCSEADSLHNSMPEYVYMYRQWSTIVNSPQGSCGLLLRNYFCVWVHENMQLDCMHTWIWLSQMHDTERDYIGIGPKVCYSSKGMNYFRKYVLLHTKLIVIKDSKKTQGYYLDRLNWKTYARTTECCCARTFVHRTHQLVQCMQWSLSCWPSAVSECVWLPLQCCTEYLAAVLRCCETVVMCGAQWLDSLVHHSLCTEPWKLLIGYSTPHTASLNQM